MDDTKKLENKLLQDNITRREFLTKISAAGLAVSVSPTFLRNSAHASTPQKGGKFRMGFSTGSTSDSLDPALLVNAWSYLLNWQVRNNLVEVDHKGNLIPELAESWEASADAAQWVFKLRKGVEFHTGKPLEANDVVYSLNHHRGEGTKSAGKVLLNAVRDIKADGKNTVSITLEGGSADFPFTLSDPLFAICPADTKGAEYEKGIGTGGYRLHTWEPGVRALMKRNPNYWKEGRAHFDEVETIAIEDVNARTNALKTNQIDYMNQCEYRTASLLKKIPGIQVISVPSGAHYTMAMHVNVPPFDNKNVRLALKCAIDREQMVKTLLQGYGTVGNDHPIGTMFQYHNPELPQRVYDPDKVKFYLKQAGLKELTVKLHTSSIRGFDDIAVLYKEQSAKAGINIEVIKEASDGYWKDVWLKKPFCNVYWNARPTEDMMLTTGYSSQARWNDTHFKSKRFDDLLKAARAELDTGKRRDLYAQLQRILNDEGGTIVIMFKDFVDAASSKVKFAEVAGNFEADGSRAPERWWFA